MASAYLSKAISTNNVAGRKTMTLSVWLKRSTASATNVIFATGSGSERDRILFENDGTLQFSRFDSSYIYRLRTTRLFRDTNAYYHFVFVYDSTQSTSSDRLKIYVNGVQETSFATASYPSQDYQSNYSQSGYTQFLGQDSDGSSDFDGIMAHVHYVDGTALTPTTFGQTDATTGIWKPKTSPSVTYGTNGFFLKFDNSANMGLDSGGSNNLTTSGTIIQTKDTPSNVFATLNPLNVPTSNAPTFSIVNTKTITMNSDPGHFGGTTTLGASSGKYYAEFKPTNSTSGVPYLIGVSSDPAEMARNGTTGGSQYSSTEWAYYSNNGNLYHDGSNSSYGNSYTTNDIIGVAIDLDNSKLYFSKNGTFQNSGVPTSGSTGTGAISIDSGETYFFMLTDLGGGVCTYECNFGNGYFGTTAVTSAQNPDDGNGIFEYDVPAGYRALCTKSLNAEEYS